MRKLTKEEKKQEVTLERFQEYHVAVGEDFIDQHEFGNPHVFAGFILAKYPQRADIILGITNDDNFCSIQQVMWAYDIPEYEDEDMQLDAFYRDYAEFVNLTRYSKEKVNEELIKAYEYYYLR